MLGAISANSGASAAMNVMLRELSNMPRSRGPSATDEVKSSDPVGGKSELTEEERKEVEKLQHRDQEVRRHESAHQAAAGANARGGATFEYTAGPDGKQYATGGEVQIDTSEVSGNPQATITKMQQIRRAANAPADPSSQDRRIAAQAAAVEAKARAELAGERGPETQGDGTDGADEAPATAGLNGPAATGGPAAPDGLFSRQPGGVRPADGAFGTNHTADHARDTQRKAGAMNPSLAPQLHKSSTSASPFDRQSKPALEPGQFIDLTV